ncbi:hypothetical protein [Nocardia sp. NPDC057227]|uniref:hypothetical protein n=1 Tax=Nocardia sp. NPDC057227 TaxID=3346056 RepID=UPI003635224B
MKRGSSAAIGLALLVAATACADPTPAPVPTPVPAQQRTTHGELCEAVARFFVNELGAVDVRAEPTIAAEMVIGGGTICEIDQGTNRIGYYSARSAPDEPDPTNRVEGFVREPALGDAVWVYDLRADAANPSTKVRFATRLEEWNATLEVVDTETRTATGALRLSDEDKIAAVRVVRELTAGLTG